MTREDEEHLRILSVCHYVAAALGALCSLFPVFHLLMGLAMLRGEFPGQGREELPRLMGWMFVVFASAAILLGLAFSACLLHAGTCLRDRRRRTFCIVVAGLACLAIPLGTVLGVFTLVVLLGDGMREAFDAGKAGA